MNKPTDAELEVLQLLWQHGPSTVRFVNDALNKNREVGYTTTLKIMQIMAEKGLAKRNTQSRTHIYQAAVNEAETQERLLTGFMNKAFGGSAMKLVMQALGGHKTSKEELQSIKDLIQRIENEQDAPQ